MNKRADTFTDAVVSVQFSEYLEAEFSRFFVSSESSNFFIGGAWGGKESTKAEATKSLRN